jgi:large subunit ribosomal protein L10
LNREQKAAAVAEIADQIRESEAVFAVDYRGITVTQAAELRSKLRDADATFRVVKNTLTERAADAADAAALKELLEGPTALTFVRGDVAVAAKALADGQKATELLAFKGGLMNGEALEPAQTAARLGLGVERGPRRAGDGVVQREDTPYDLDQTGVRDHSRAQATSP